MSTSDAILVGEDWISEHYFTTDATSQSFQARVLERRKAWDAEAKEGRFTPLSRFTATRQSLEVDLAGLEEMPDGEGSPLWESVESIYGRVLDVLGLTRHGLVTEATGPLIRVSSPGITENAPLSVIHAKPAASVEEILAKDASSLPVPVALDGEEAEFMSAARLASALFVADDGPDLILILAGRWIVLAEKERWAEGRYLAIDLQLVCERNETKRGGEVDRALTCLSAESIAPDSDGNLWWHGVFDDSVKHTVGVSQDLRDGVRASIEIIANEVVTRRAARDLPPLPAAEAQPLAKQALRFLYRILFLLYAEASPQLGVLPVGTQEYGDGYSLDRLRELVQVELTSARALEGTHLYESLGALFRLVDSGHQPAAEPHVADGGAAVVEDGSAFAPGLTFNALRADLFRPEATAHIDEVGLGNRALQDVLTRLLLSKEKRGRDRGFISYAELGINQLGAVYEGLMSYTGFFAETDLYEVAKGGDSSKGSWVVPIDRAEGIDSKDFVRHEDPRTAEQVPVKHDAGSFVFRLAGRERQQSASYYTPEVLTRFTVGQALEELLDQDGPTPASQILEMTVCEPALGSGAFAIEAVRQLAERYLDRRQEEVGRRIDPDEYPQELQRVKAYLALHNVYGVDLNATAVELAEISLWLDTMVSGLAAPWFGLHLRRGNSLIGARRAVYRRDQVNDKSWLKSVPRDSALNTLVEDLRAGSVGGDLGGGIHHFLLPADGWGAAADAKEAATLAPDATATLKRWRGSIKAKPTKQQVDALAELAHRVEVLWQFAYRRLEIAEREIRRSVPVWEAGELPEGGAVQREQIEAALADANGAYRRLRRVMDAWTALWFWPLTKDSTTVQTPDGTTQAQPPTLAQWIDALQRLLGRSPELRKKNDRNQETLASSISWDELADAEELEITLAGTQPIERVVADHPWLVVCDRVAEQQGFFHWDLDFAAVSARGGFDLQVGNPPWVRPRADVDALLAEGDPWWQLATKPSESLRATMRLTTMELPGVTELVVAGTTDVAGTAAFVGAVPQYPHLKGLQPDLYRCFMEQTWRHASSRGAVGLIHPETHFTDEKAGLLREATYTRLRRHWQFVNELQLFEIDHHVSYGIHVYGEQKSVAKFQMATSLYHPDTIIRSYDHDGSGAEPGLKDPDGNWDLRPHASRIITVTDQTLATWHAVLETPTVPVRRTRMVYAVNRSVADVLDKLSRAPRIGELGLEFSAGWHEKNDRTKGYFESAWGAPESWDDVILQGPHLYVATPLYKTPNKTMLHNLDWSATDFETLTPDAIPVTAYKPIGDRYRYDVGYTEWGTDDDPKPARDYYRIAWRRMAANTGVRTLIAAPIPPGASHVNPVLSMAVASNSLPELAQIGAFASSLILDFSVRTAPKSEILFGTIGRLPYVRGHALGGHLLLRYLRLTCLTSAYAEFWDSCYLPSFRIDSWSSPERRGNSNLGDVLRTWSARTPLRIAIDRRQAMLEIDALVALMLDLTADELCTIYRTQFAVLYGYDRDVYFYDVNGRLVPNEVLRVWRAKGDRIAEEERTATNQTGNTYTYEFPFVTLDREADMRQAYAHFEQLLRECS
ncbi:class I SAM-dependent DNA methyltransferase [Occultella aeris]|uniref:site-specific DNA-methyltransferase (adenine-specific) n=1 Tax=Occultella aeris TaxID=2761496 RepID=A0A7M4DPM4_9MICO|nr:class I SAM-dependent DNA methyltransferase [Occultella aeris]VZO39418.1 hypothetical protein HALOF300_04106 [Occultella aeris]